MKQMKAIGRRLSLKGVKGVHQAGERPAVDPPAAEKEASFGPPPPLSPDAMDGDHFLDHQDEAALEVPTAVPSGGVIKYVLRVQQQNYLYKALLYTLFVASFGAINMLVRPVRTTWSTQETMEDAFAKENLGGIYFDKTYYDIGTTDDIWRWMETVLLPVVLPDSLINDNDPRVFVRMANRIISPIRIRQVSVTEGSCGWPAEVDVQRPCWESFKNSIQASEDRVTLLNPYLRYEKRLPDLIGIDGYGYGYDYGHEAHILDIPLTNEGRFVYENYVKQGVGKTIDEGDESGGGAATEPIFLGGGTAVFVVEFLTYNANYDTLTRVRFVNDMMIGGRIHSSIALHSCRLQPYRTGADFARLACEVFFFLCLCVYVLREMNELRVYKLEYFKSFWNLVELTNIAMYLTILVYWSRFLLEDRFQYLEFSPTEYRDPGKVIELFTFTSAVAAVNVIIGCFTIFKYLQVNPKLSLLWVALSNAAVDILPFIMVFFLVTIGFTFAGHWLFGTRVAGFHTWGESFSTLLRSLTGEYDYESLQLADSAAAPAYTVGWIFIVTLVLINMFIAILTDAFELTKDRIRRIADFQDQAGEGFMLRTALLDSVEGIARQFAEKENVDPDRKVHTKKLKRVRKEVFQNPQLLFIHSEIQRVVKKLSVRADIIERITAESVDGGKPEVSVEELASYLKGDIEEAQGFVNNVNQFVLEIRRMLETADVGAAPVSVGVAETDRIDKQLESEAKIGELARRQMFGWSPQVDHELKEALNMLRLEVNTLSALLRKLERRGRS